MQESNQTSGPDTAAELTALASWIDEKLGNEHADRQSIAEGAAARVRDIRLQMLGAAALGHGGAELAARRTAAAAVRGDFEREWHGYSMQGGAEPAWPVWAQRLSESVASLLDAPGPAPADSAGVSIPAEPGDGQDPDDDTEPYCLTCREWVGIFQRMEGWHHFRGDGFPGGIRTLFEADHEPVIGWIVPPGRGLSPAGMETLRQALGDAIEYRTPGADCADCDASPAGLCADHAADLDKTDACLQLARTLGIEIER